MAPYVIRRGGGNTLILIKRWGTDGMRQIWPRETDCKQHTSGELLCQDVDSGLLCPREEHLKMRPRITSVSDFFFMYMPARKNQKNVFTAFHAEAGWHYTSWLCVPYTRSTSYWNYLQTMNEETQGFSGPPTQGTWRSPPLEHHVAHVNIWSLTTWYEALRVNTFKT